MNTIRKTAGILLGASLIAGYALPAAALDVYGTVNSATNATVNVGGTTGVNATVNAGADVNAGGNASSSNTSNSGSSSASANTTTNGSVEIAPLIITRLDVDSGNVQASAAAPAAVHTTADLSGYIAAKVKSDTNVSQVATSDDTVAVVYKQHAKLFGFIPVTVDATAEVNADGSVSVHYPWYTIFASTNRAELQSKLQSDVNATLGTDGSASADASADATVQFTNETKAQLVAAIQAAMQAELEADASANANANVNSNQ